jgi:hypothetical protein
MNIERNLLSSAEECLRSIRERIEQSSDATSDVHEMLDRYWDWKREVMVVPGDK